MRWFKAAAVDYQAVSDDDEIKGPPVTRPSRFQGLFALNAWFGTTILLSLVILFQSVNTSTRGPVVPSIGSFESRFDTELNVPSEKPLERRRFSWGIRDGNGTLFPVFNESAPQYVGLPSKEIDDNWQQLVGGRYIRFKDEEVEWMDQDHVFPNLTALQGLPTIQTDGFYGGASVFHNLHCLNAIRKHLDIDHYGSVMAIPKHLRRMHIDHCLDQLRQSLMCSADLTPVTLKPVYIGTEGSAGITYLLGQTEREHVCRNWEEIREWVTRRGNETGSVL